MIKIKENNLVLIKNYKFGKEFMVNIHLKLRVLYVKKKLSISMTVIWLIFNLCRKVVLIIWIILYQHVKNVIYLWEK